MAEWIDLLDQNYGILCVGNISENKNQKMLVDAFRILDKSILQNAVLILIGGGEEELRDYVEENKIGRVYFAGTIPKDDVFSYMKKADLLVMASLNEGFGLPVVEAYSHGVPVVMPQSVDAFADVYCEDACIPVAEYTPKCFADAIASAYGKQWDREKILAFAEKFSMQECSKQYLAVLRSAATEKRSPLTSEEFQNAVRSCQ